ncbi:MAG: PhoX family protein, partial [Chitinophagales bacterium]
VLDTGFTAELPKLKHSPCLSEIDYEGISFSNEDNVVLTKELKHDLLIKWQDVLTDKESFGFNNDYINFVPLTKNGNEGILWVNHESPDRFMILDKMTDTPTKEEVEKEMYSVGGALVHIKKDLTTNTWAYIKNSPYNRRFSALTLIPFANNVEILGTNIVMGTLGNCAGGKTPWNTILTCEENYDMFYGETVYKEGMVTRTKSEFGWEKFYDNPPEHYGWVVEINPISGEAKKHISMGRMAHECATTTRAKNGKVVVYTGDDTNDEHLYKFISDAEDNLDTGVLYVANLESGDWVPLDKDINMELSKLYRSQVELLIQTRIAAKIAKATPLARPEDIEIHPLTRDVYITLTNNKPKGNYHGSILKIMEENADAGSLKFNHEYFLTGGEESGFSCPDNLAFDNKNNLWFTSDIAAGSQKKKQYEHFKNNGLFMVPVSGKNAGKVVQIASAPNAAEFTGPYFSPDFKTLFLSVQHPGETSKDKDNFISHWPNGGTSKPIPAVIQISLK